MVKRWILPKISKELVNNLAEECGIDPFLSLICAVRGYDDPVELDAFLSCDDTLEDPFCYADMEKAAEVINAAIEENKLIAIYGDYDCDGVTATALLYTYLCSRGASVIPYIPNRADEGYGMNIDSLEKLDGKGVSLIITVDNGINAVAEVEMAKSRGMQVVITDHHMPIDELPEADAVVDPHRVDCPSEFKELSGVGVAFKLVCALENATPEELLPLYADLVAIGTVADVMPLTRENRVFVREGLLYINNTSRIGLSALINAAGLEGKQLKAGNLAFNLAPRINAAGRMGDAMRAFSLLCADNAETAEALAAEISAENVARQKIESDIEKEAVAIIERQKLNYDRVIVVCGKNWHRGVVGIAASRLIERYGKPVIVLGAEDGVAVGSGRSVEGFSLFDAVNYAEKHLQKYGGHSLAVGLTINETDIDAFRADINSFARKKEICVPSVSLDCKLNPAALSVEMAELISELEPFGKGNPTPLFGIYSLKIERINPISEGKHLRLILVRDTAVIQALIFNKTVESFPFEEGDTVDIAATLDINEWRGDKTLSVIVREIRPSGESEADIESLFDYDDFMSNNAPRDLSHITPSRDEIGLLYRCVVRPINKRTLINKTIGRLLCGKANIAIDILCELGLITEKRTGDNIIISKVNGARSDLEKSEILRILKEGETE